MWESDNRCTETTRWGLTLLGNPTAFLCCLLRFPHSSTAVPWRKRNSHMWQFSCGSKCSKIFVVFQWISGQLLGTCVHVLGWELVSLNVKKASLEISTYIYRELLMFVNTRTFKIHKWRLCHLRFNSLPLYPFAFCLGHLNCLSHLISVLLALNLVYYGEKDSVWFTLSS